MAQVIASLRTPLLAQVFHRYTRLYRREINLPVYQIDWNTKTTSGTTSPQAPSKQKGHSNF
ncbi:hypothetical protein HMPREF9069_00697 [Atopobium sp. oral taxon 810 str. F0209]|nr:hypothetical protein HMPREF9069_00697 [Atopobium sp. oral taxon 810 str. F0209]